MIYIIFAITAIINIFNILLISNNKIVQDKKEKVLLVTYSIAELVYILFALTTVQYTAANTVVVLGFVIIWLLSKSYILVVNMDFNDNRGEVITMENEIVTNDNGIEEVSSEEIEIISEVSKEKVELPDLIEDDNIEVVEDEKNDCLVEKTQEDIFTPTSFHDLADIVEIENINKDEETRVRRRSLALKISKIENAKILES